MNLEGLEYKVLVLGGPSSGKAEFIFRYVYGFMHDRQHTIGGEVSTFLFFNNYYD